MADVDERPPGPLAQTGVVVTRPANQAAHLSALLEAAGARVFRFPAIAIVPPRDTDRLEAVLDRLAQFQIAVFVSANAVDWGERYLDMFGGLPASLKVAAVGRGTASALQERGLAPDLVPAERYDTEALLALPEFQESAVSGQRVLILRGEGGRELLADTLYARGAEVEYAEVYRRVRPGIDPGKLLEPLAKGEVDVIIVTSGEGLRNLLDMVGDAARQWLYHTPLLVVSERLADLARSMGFRVAPIVAARAGDEELVEALSRWRCARADVVRGIP
ncbi:MAG: uroporphyrinogen-III synthase [Gammaproteobacteria bacterium]|nr:uroporphyrinogen-III synthase [Gammaproteobacteria bacterium]MDJ0872641.1 uroporphyrinogen-III synthase [Gammaproteobacteria bacterium]MDJ0890117.1 uroporphyrinogen-III synthase [Gammaproteobacteria bacterium]